MESRIIKVGILIVLLVVPALVFIYLKTFGDNTLSLHYYLPETYSNGKIKIVEGDTLFYTVPDYNLEYIYVDKSLLSSGDPKIKVLSFQDVNCDSLQPEINVNIGRLHETFKNDKSVSIVSIYASDKVAFETSLTELRYDKNNWSTAILKDELYIEVLSKANVKRKDFKLSDSCGNLDGHINVLLTDKQNKIRGIYNALDVNDIERLRLEIKVLKNINERE